ncbi:hypothetical protein [Desulfitobacterium metallireducens]|uniref:Uncharacterized protein n=1 Tax=Desulfitobacterium metallireducens DSM 15288 TaxID=871968 RepID=W0EC97_9FIRM|nr:hypothetical protein [Desulfitobacterium metallireducens]AHF08387.1 hypothetical protein DESME_01655 [Desulfitobacterium metallireducens DSM 15288]
MAEQKCPKCNSRHGFEIVPLLGCEELEAVQCKTCGAPITILNPQIIRSMDALLQRLDSICGKSTERNS